MERMKALKESQSDPRFQKGSIHKVDSSPMVEQFQKHKLESSSLMGSTSSIVHRHHEVLYSSTGSLNWSGGMVHTQLLSSASRASRLDDLNQDGEGGIIAPTVGTHNSIPNPSIPQHHTKHLNTTPNIPEYHQIYLNTKPNIFKYQTKHTSIPYINNVPLLYHTLYTGC